MARLGELKKVSIRDIWKREPDFSAWLAEDENIKKLGQKIGVDILTEATEAGVGDFSADILAREDGGERLVIIENQYGDTNHDHLGKLITYAAGRGAKVLIWVVENARDEHRAAVQWLNDNTAADIGIFLVQIEILRIGDSAPAPMFTVLERPNDWTKQIKQGAITKTNQLQLDFWNRFMDYAMKKPEYTKLFNRLKGQAQNWLSLPLGSAEYQISLTVKTFGKIGAEVYIHKRKDIFKNLESKKDQIEKELGFKMDWQPLPERMASRIEIVLDGDFTNTNKWNDYFEWLVEKAIILKKVFPKYLKSAGKEK